MLEDISWHLRYYEYSFMFYISFSSAIVFLYLIIYCIKMPTHKISNLADILDNDTKITDFFMSRHGVDSRAVKTAEYCIVSRQDTGFKVIPEGEEGEEDEEAEPDSDDESDADESTNMLQIPSLAARRKSDMGFLRPPETSSRTTRANSFADINVMRHRCVGSKNRSAEEDDDSEDVVINRNRRPQQQQVAEVELHAQPREVVVLQKHQVQVHYGNNNVARPRVGQSLLDVRSGESSHVTSTTMESACSLDDNSAVGGDRNAVIRFRVIENRLHQMEQETK